MKKIVVIDSHTGGEPTRLIVGGGPELGGGAMQERRARFRSDFDEVRTAVIGEPRGSDIMVGGLLCKPEDPAHAAGVIFFDNDEFLGMCGHGMIGMVVSLHHLGRIGLGKHTIETAVGVVSIELIDAHTVRLQNVPAYRWKADVRLDVPEYGEITGDIAWGGNWFFLVKNDFADLDVGHAPKWLELTRGIRKQLHIDGWTGEDGGEINHIELHGPAKSSDVDCRSFVLCPGGAYDRSPCGTGTSAKMACLASDGKLKPGQLFRQESIVGSVFEGTVQRQGDRWIPTIEGQAYVSGESELILSPLDPFRFGIRT